MALLLNPRIWAAIVVAVLLAFTHGFAYKSGRAMVANDWAQERLENARLSGEAAQVRQAREADLIKRANDVDKAFQSHKTAAAADRSAAADELRLLEAALAASGAHGNPIAPSGADGAGTGQLLLACAGEHQAMAAEADTVAVRLTGLQSYVLNVCKTP